MQNLTCSCPVTQAKDLSNGPKRARYHVTNPHENGNRSRSKLVFPNKPRQRPMSRTSDHIFYIHTLLECSRFLIPTITIDLTQNIIKFWHVNWTTEDIHEYSQLLTCHVSVTHFKTWTVSNAQWTPIQLTQQYQQVCKFIQNLLNLNK
jgi:hypothetical protein